MRALFLYAAMAAVFLWRLPRLKEGGSRGLAATWALLWAGAAVLTGLWLWGPESWRLAELLLC